ncbi:MAG: response regulator [Chloroflexi bacterium]|nr:MAG: response regulator [Chloroflexota bacterium]
MKKSVLILADDLLASTLLKLLLKPVGFHVHTVVDSTNVFREVEAHKPDIILIDSQTLNKGLSISREIRDIADMKSLPIVLLSNCTYLQGEQASHAAGVNTHLYKPVSRHDLVNEIQLAAAKQFSFA